MDVAYGRVAPPAQDQNIVSEVTLEKNRGDQKESKKRLLFLCGRQPGNSTTQKKIRKKIVKSSSLVSTLAHTGKGIYILVRNLV